MDNQAQIASLCGLIQLRRDHHLAAAKGLLVDNLQALRQTKALMQSTSKKERSSQRKPDTCSKPIYDDFAPHLSVPPVVFPVVGASCSGPPTDSGCPGDSSHECPQDTPSSFLKNTPHSEVFFFPTPPVPQESSDTGAPEDSFVEERALISAQAHIPVGGKLQFFWRNWKVI